MTLIKMFNRNSWLSKFFSGVTTFALVFSLIVPFFVPKVLQAAVVPVANGSFTNGTDASGSDWKNISDWEEKGSENDSSTLGKNPSSGDDSASPDGGRFAKIGRYNDGNDGNGWICQEIDAEGYASLVLKYYWRGDSDAENNSDIGRIEYIKNGSCESSDNQWSLITSHELDDNDANTTAWSSLQALPLPGTLNDEEFFLRFRGVVSASDEAFRVDGVSLEGTPLPATLIVEKKVTNNSGGSQGASSFSFQVNGGSATAFEGDGKNNITVTPGVYNVVEVNAPGYTTTYDGCSNINIGPGETKTCKITNNDVPDVCPNIQGWQGTVPEGYHKEGNDCISNTATISATKVVCDSEENLPNWGAGGPNITSTTATSFVSQSDGNCRLEPDWVFEWSPTYTENTGDNDADAGWTNFSSPTDVNGVATVSVPANTPTVWVREEMKPDYLPFSGDTSGEDGWNDVSAEMYCDTDVLNYDNFDYISSPQGGQTYHCVAFNVELIDVCKNIEGLQALPPQGYIIKNQNDQSECVPEFVSVELCKVDENNQPLSGWTLTLSGEEVQNDLLVPTNTSAGINSNPLVSGVSYLAKVVGTWLNQGGANPVDAEYSTTDAWATQMDGYTGYSTDILELQINNAFDPNSNWGAYNSLHTYAQSFIQGSNAPANFRIYDGTGGVQNEGWFGDNIGTLSVDLNKGYAGITGENGCVNFTNVPYGNYTVGEVMQDGWELMSLPNENGTVQAYQLTNKFTVKNKKIPEETTATIHATKIVCDSEDDLPNWGAGGANIISTTATDFLALDLSEDQKQDCHIEPWTFEWVQGNTGNPGDNMPGTLGSPWSAFSTASPQSVPSGSIIWVREQFNANYIPFTGRNTDQNVSAEMYCHTDVLNYDNYDWIDPVEAGEDYYCVAFNVPVIEGPQCVENTEDQFMVTCNSPEGGQLCATNYDKVITVETAGTVDAIYDVHPNHCSSVRIHTYVDNVLVGTTPYLGYNNVGQMSAQLFNDLNLAPGVHTISLKAEGTVGGCNGGLLGSWGGTLSLDSDNICSDDEEPLACNPQVNLLQNGGFENPDLATNSWDIVQDVVLNPSSVLGWLVDWVVVPSGGRLGLEIQDHVAGDPAEGGQHAELDGDHPVKIWQDIATIPGKTYHLKFKYSPRPGSESGTNMIEARANGTLLGAVLTALGGSNTNWTSETRTFVADSSTTKIEFIDIDTDNSYGGYLDDISLTCDPNDDEDEETTITVTKVVVGGDMSVSSFPLYIGDGLITSGETIEVEEGLYVVSEDGHPDYIPTFSGACKADNEELYNETIAKIQDWLLKKHSLQDAIAGDPDSPHNGYRENLIEDINAKIEALQDQLQGVITLDDGDDAQCTITNTFVPNDNKESLTGSIEIKKYVCPANTLVNRIDNGVGGEAPEGCIEDAGAYFGYVHGEQEDANGPYPELSLEPIPGGQTSEGGILIIPSLPAFGRYLVVETDSDNEKLGHSEILGLYCEGDGDTNPNNNDNQELTFVEAGETAHCVAYNKMTANEEGENTSHTTLVNPSNMNGWVFFPENTNSGQAGTMVFGPTGQPLGVGSAEFVLTANNQGEVLGMWDLKGTRLDKIVSLAYSTYRGTSGVALPALQFEFDNDRTDADNTFKGRLVYEPYYTHTITDGLWQTWNPMDNSESGGNGNWWFSNATQAANSGCSIATPCTWTEILSYAPNGGIRDNGAFTGITLFKAGSGSTFTANVDKFVIGIQSGINTHTETYDFEPTVQEFTSFACSDGIDNDLDGKIDFNGGDPGCESGEDNSETDGSGGGGGVVPTSFGGTAGGPAGQVLGATTTCGIYLDKFIRLGYKNDIEAVKKLQQFLNEYEGEKLPVTGVYGPLTYQAVIRFQKKHMSDVLGPWGIVEPTGIVYLTTQRLINNIMCPDLNLPVPTLIDFNKNPLAKLD